MAFGRPWKTLYKAIFSEKFLETSRKNHYFMKKTKKSVDFLKISGIIAFVDCGVWRSLVARTAGGREVAGSNPVAPIFLLKIRVFSIQNAENPYFVGYL